jgi:hypothetical protein
MLSRKYGLTFVHHPFVRSQFDANTDWEEFLQFGIGETDARQVLQNKQLKTVWLPPIPLADERNIALVGRIINQTYPQNNMLFRLATNVFFGVTFDQSEVLPPVYSKKYEAARRKYPLDLSLDTRYLHIGLHIRRGADIKALKDTNQWKYRWISDAYYLNALEDVLTFVHDVPFQIHIFSDGEEDELCAFRGVPNCVLHLHEDEKRAFHGMVSMDILVSSSSAFAICAGKMSRGLKLIGRDFDQAQFRLFVPETSDWVRVEPTGHLSDHAKIQVREGLAHRGLSSRSWQNAR